MLKKIRSSYSAFHKTIRPAVRYIFYKPDRFLKTCQVYKRMLLPSGLEKTYCIPEDYFIFKTIMSFRVHEKSPTQVG